MNADKRRSVVLTLCLAVIMIFTAALAVSAADEIESASGYIDSWGGVNFRKAASTSSKRIGGIRNKKKVTILSEVFVSKDKYDSKYKWYKVKYAGKTGYVRSDLVDGVNYVIVKGKTTDNLNYRRGAGTEMNRKGTIAKGSSVKVVGKARAKGSDTDWYKLVIGSKYMYACSTWIKLNGAGEKDEPEQKPVAKTADTSLKALRASSVIRPNSGANMRVKADAKSSKVTALKKGWKVTIYREVFTSKDNPSSKNKWYKASNRSKMGYVRSDLVDQVDYVAVKATITDDVNVRSGAGTEMNRIDGLSKGQTVYVLCKADEKGRGNVWCKVKYGDAYGYVCADYVKLGDTSKTKTIAGPRGFTGKIYEYYQYNYGVVAGQNIGGGGCGGTSIAVILSSLLGRTIDPPTVVTHQMSVGGWSKQYLTHTGYFKQAADHWGVKYADYKKSEYKDALSFMETHQAMMVVRVSKSYWTKGMHFFVIAGASGDTVNVVQVGSERQTGTYSFSKDIYPYLHDSKGDSAASMYMFYK